MENGSVIVPPAQGTYGSMARNMLRGKPCNEWDASLFKNWKFKERLGVQFRFQVYSVLNRTSYIASAANPDVPTTLGQSSSTTNSGFPAIGSDSPGELQLGLKFLF
jgi:hypothetical protein